MHADEWAFSTSEPKYLPTQGFPPRPCEAAQTTKGKTETKCTQGGYAMGHYVPIQGFRSNNCIIEKLKKRYEARSPAYSLIYGSIMIKLKILDSRDSDTDLL